MRESERAVTAQGPAVSDGDGAEGGLGASDASGVEQGEGLGYGQQPARVVGEQVKLHGGVGVAEHQNVGFLFRGVRVCRDRTGPGRLGW